MIANLWLLFHCYFIAILLSNAWQLLFAFCILLLKELPLNCLCHLTNHSYLSLTLFFSSLTIRHCNIESIASFTVCISPYKPDMFQTTQYVSKVIMRMYKNSFEEMIHSSRFFYRQYLADCSPIFKVVSFFLSTVVCTGMFLLQACRNSSSINLRQY